MNYHHRHPIAKRLPVQQPARINMNVQRATQDQVRDDYLLYNSGVICECFPRPSSHTIPSMFYDKLTCPHQHHAHIQPAQHNQFNYPWTANSTTRRNSRSADDDVLSRRQSLISEELNLSPGPYQQRQPDAISLHSAPPFLNKDDTTHDSEAAPYTAPANITQVGTNGREANTIDNMMTEEGQLRHYSRLQNRQFTGSYVDPRTGKVLKYDVRYNGTPKPVASRQANSQPAINKTMTA